MEITLKSMRISGFKGINDLTLDLNNQSAIISGSNGTGKTSVYDAFLWCLTGKDSAGYQSDVKPVDANGQRVLGRDSDVVAILRFADATGAATDVTLHRQLHEVWSKPRDAADKVCSRDETLCWINDVPKKIDREYTPEVINLFGGNESTFRLLTSYTAFMAMNWPERRQALLDMVGDIDVPGFEDISEILNGATPDDARKRLNEQMKRHNDTLSAIPARIDELQRTLAQISDDEYKSATRTISEIVGDIDTIDRQLNGKSDTAQKMNTLLARKRELSAEQSKIAAAANSERQTIMTNARIARSKIESKLSALQDTFNRNQSIVLKDTDQLTERKASCENLLSQYHYYENMVYKEPKLDTRCP
ncbi:MAG TPA: AAA family ATPase, partial [Candidatus Omnitrophota bacterium]|nr:AAA family ATPase [Candidatus Omnitrophota bacterium]